MQISTATANIKIVLIPICFMLLSIPPMEKVTDAAYFYGSAIGLVITIITSNESLFVIFVCAGISIIIMLFPAICSAIKVGVPKALRVFAKYFAITNGVMGMLVMYGKWY